MLATLRKIAGRRCKRWNNRELIGLIVQKIKYIERTRFSFRRDYENLDKFRCQLIVLAKNHSDDRTYDTIYSLEMYRITFAQPFSKHLLLIKSIKKTRHARGVLSIIPA